MKKFFMVLATTLICGACVFTSCKKDKDKDQDKDLNLKENIIGTWMMADKNGQPLPTNEKLVYTLRRAAWAMAASKTLPATIVADDQPSGSAMTRLNCSQMVR